MSIDRVYELAKVPAVVEIPPKPWVSRLLDMGSVRRLIVLSGFLAAWQIYSALLSNPLLFPTPFDTFVALFDGLATGKLLSRVGNSLGLLFSGFALGVLLAIVLTGFAMVSRFGRDALATLTAMFNPLPAIALLPLAMLWFGLGTGSVIFVLVHSVLWSVALNVLNGFEGVSPTLRMVGRNLGLKGFGYIGRILVPAAFPSILTGLKVGWAFAWRTLIAAELVFGVSAGSGGLGWYIYENKNQLEIASVFAGLLAVIIIGLTMEYVVFRMIENRTTRRWGMQN